MLDAAIKIFFYPNQTMYEVACEPSHNCNIDQQTFKAYLSRWLAASVKVAPWTRESIMPLLAASAQAAAQSVSPRSLRTLRRSVNNISSAPVATTA